MRYPFYLAENLTTTALSRDAQSFARLVERNFEVIMKDRGQTATMRWLRVAQLQAHLTRAVFRAGANPQALIDVSFEFLERFSRCPVRDEGRQRQLLMDCCRRTVALVPQTPRSHSSLLQRFLKTLERDELGLLTVDGIARDLGVSPSHLCRAIKTSTGRTPAQHIRLAKLSHARELLPETSVTRAAMDSGFGKTSTFIAHFRKHYGETPGSFRRRVALGEAARSLPLSRYSGRGSG